MGAAPRDPYFRVRHLVAQLIDECDVTELRMEVEGVEVSVLKRGTLVAVVDLAPDSPLTPSQVRSILARLGLRPKDLGLEDLFTN